MLDTTDTPDEVQSAEVNLPHTSRAALALNSSKTEADLMQLADGLKAIKQINSAAGRDQAHALAMTARNARTTIEKAGKAARDDANKFSKAVIAEEDRLIQLIQPEENRVLGLRNQWDAAEQARKDAEARIERERIERHQAVIATINSFPGLARDARTAAMTRTLLEKLHLVETSLLDEFADAGAKAKALAIEQLGEIILTKQFSEDQAARIKQEQEAEAARLAEQARLQAEHQARIEAQQAELERQAAALAQQAAALEARKAEADKPVEVPMEPEIEVPMEPEIEVPMEPEIEVPMEPEIEVPMEPEIVPQPQFIPVLEPTTPTDHTPEAPPSAHSLASTIAFEYGVELVTALRWLAERADEFKQLHDESSK